MVNRCLVLARGGELQSISKHFLGEQTRSRNCDTDKQAKCLHVVSSTSLGTKIILSRYQRAACWGGGLGISCMCIATLSQRHSLLRGYNGCGHFLPICCRGCPGLLRNVWDFWFPLDSLLLCGTFGLK